MNPQPTFEQNLTAWKWAVAGQKKAQWPIEIVAHSRSEFDQWADELLQAQKDAKAKGYECRFNGTIKGQRLAAWATSKSHTIKVVFDAKAKRPQAVTQTSREAYKTVDLGERCEAVARAAIKLGVCTDNEVGREIGMPANLVSGRRNNIEDAGGITIDGVVYVVKMSGVAKRDEITKRSGNVWFLEKAFEGWKPKEMPAQAVQSSLFQ